MSDAGLRGCVLRPHRHKRAQIHRHVPIYACRFAQMYVEGSEGFSLELEIGLGLVATVSADRCLNIIFAVNRYGFVVNFSGYYWATKTSA